MTSGHAAIPDWPWIERDLTSQKAPQIGRVAVIAGEAAL